MLAVTPNCPRGIRSPLAPSQIREIPAAVTFPRKKREIFHLIKLFLPFPRHQGFTQKSIFLAPHTMTFQEKSAQGHSPVCCTLIEPLLLPRWPETPKRGRGERRDFNSRGQTIKMSKQNAPKLSSWNSYPPFGRRRFLATREGKK